MGAVATVVGCIDPLEGAIAVLMGSGLISLAAALAGSRWVKLSAVAFAMIAAGVMAMVVLGSLGGVGGHSGRSMWWAVTIAPYPVGGVIAIAGAAFLTAELFRVYKFS